MDKTIAKSVFSVVLYLAFLELFLRIGGFAFLWMQEHKNRQILTAGSHYTIMCIGDSNTAIGGEDSYPSLLEKALNERAGGPKFKVINRGLPAANSTIIMKDLGSWLTQYKPDMVVAMMGANDRYEPKPLGGKNKMFELLAPLGSLQITKLFKGIGADIQAKINSWSKHAPPPHTFKPVPEKYAQLLFYAINVKANGDCETAEKVFFTLANIPGIEPSFQLRAADEARECFYKEKKYPELMWALNIALEENEFNVESIDIIRALTRQGEAKNEIIALLTKLTNERPDSMPLNGLLGACYAQFGNKAMADRYINKIEAMRRGGDITPLKESYLKLHRMLREHHIQGVYVQYPMRSIDVLKRMLMSERDYDSMIFIDNEDPFKEALKPEKYSEYFEDRNYDDLGHCTPKGNRLLAGNTADAILKYLHLSK